MLDAGARLGKEHVLTGGRRGAGGDVGDIREEEIGEGGEEGVGGGRIGVLVGGWNGGGGGRIGLDGD